MEIKSQEIGKIYSFEYPDSSEINFGPCYVGDSLISKFVLENYSNEKFTLKPISPSFSISRSPKEVITDEFRSFRIFQTTLPIHINPLSNQNLLIQFRADTNIVIFPLGWYNAIMEIGYSKEDTDSIYLYKQFDLKAKKTRKYIDGYDDILHFDSVYVNPPMSVERTWRVKSTFKDSVSILSQKFTLLSQQLTNNEFNADLYQINPVFRKKYDIIDWKIHYYPLDLGTDTGLVELNYKPLPETYPDSIQTAFVKTIGTGVKQDLRLISSNFSFRNDTIFVGNQQTLKPFKIVADIFNSGNIPFGTLSESMSSSNIDFDYNITAKLIKNSYLFPGKSDDFDVNVTLKELGNFTIKYNLESDIINRRIKFPPNDSKMKTIYIVGKAVEPVIQMLSDTVDFENVYLYLPFCPSSKDTNLTIYNVGNDTLRINKIDIVKQKPNYSFTSDNPEIQIPPNSKYEININFEPTFASDYSADLIIYNNSQTPEYTVHLMGVSTTPAITNIRIDTIAGKPGSIINIPVKVDSNIVYANEFEDTLFYDRSLLHYVGYITVNTASNQPIEKIIAEESIEGKLYLHIKKHPKTRFTQNSTLIYLQFKAFLGDAKSTEISFMNPRFGNEICSNALNLPKSNIHDGIFKIDSICGIDYKAFPQTVIINSVYPNPSVDFINVDFTLTEPEILTFEIFDELGNSISRTEPKEFMKGDYSHEIELRDLNFGIQYLKIVTGKGNTIFQKVIKIK